MTGGYPPIKICVNTNEYKYNQEHSFISKNNINIFDLLNKKKTKTFKIDEDNDQIEIINDI
jgi:hypothetical protein